MECLQFKVASGRLERAMLSWTRDDEYLSVSKGPCSTMMDHLGMPNKSSLFPRSSFFDSARP